MEVLLSKNPQQTAAAALSGLLVAHTGRSVLLMVSGGSALSFLDQVETDSVDRHLTLTVLDERFSVDPAINNFAQLEQTSFYQSCSAQGAKHFSTIVEPDETIEDVRDKFAAALYTWKTENPDGVVIATMGIGADGHTAGIFPGDNGVDMTGVPWVVSYEVSSDVHQFTKRITVTHTFLRVSVDVAIVFAVGKEKRPYLTRLQSGEETLSELPSAILNEMRSVIVVTDAR